MSAPAARNVLRMPGKLVKSPTSLSTTYPYGGTELGVLRNVMWTPGTKYDRAIAEEWKTAVAAFVEEERTLVAAVLRSWDNDLLSWVHRNVQTSAFGDVGLLGRVQGTGVNRAGYDQGDLGAKLLFAPQAPGAHRALLLHNAVPMLDESAELQLSISREFGLALMFEAFPDATGRTFSFDFLENLASLL